MHQATLPTKSLEASTAFMLEDKVATVGSCTVSCGGPVGFGGAGSLNVSPATLLSILYRVAAGEVADVDEPGRDTGGVAPFTQ